MTQTSVLQCGSYLALHQRKKQKQRGAFYYFIAQRTTGY
jgi:hypothetical protein